VRVRVDRSLARLAVVVAVVGVGAGTGGMMGSVPVGAAVTVTLALGGLAMLQIERRRVHRTVSTPVEMLAHAVHADAAAAGSDASEAAVEDLVALVDGIADVPADVAAVAAHVVVQQDRVAALGALIDRRDRLVGGLEDDLRLLASLADEVAGSVDASYVVEVMTRALRVASGAEQVVLRLGDGLPAGPAEEGLPPGTHGRGAGALVALAAGHHTMGVAELVGVHDEDLAPQQRWTLQVIAAHGAAVLRSARLEHQVAIRGRVDPVTGLANYQQFVVDLAVEVHRARRYGRPVALVLIDLAAPPPADGSMAGGSPAGGLVAGGSAVFDDVLVVAASALGSRSRGCDTVYRFGASQVAVLVRDADEGGAAAYAGRAARRVADTVARTLGMAVAVTVGVGALDVAPWSSLASETEGVGRGDHGGGGGGAGGGGTGGGDDGAELVRRAAVALRAAQRHASDGAPIAVARWSEQATGQAELGSGGGPDAAMGCIGGAATDPAVGGVISERDSSPSAPGGPEGAARPGG
jgi:GGDEF domain-containing protein